MAFILTKSTNPSVSKNDASQKGISLRIPFLPFFLLLESCLGSAGVCPAAGAADPSEAVPVVDFTSLTCDGAAGGAPPSPFWLLGAGWLGPGGVPVPLPMASMPTPVLDTLFIWLVTSRTRVAALVTSSSFKFGSPTLVVL